MILDGGDEDRHSIVMQNIPMSILTAQILRLEEKMYFRKLAG